MLEYWNRLLREVLESHCDAIVVPANLTCSVTKDIVLNMDMPTTEKLTDEVTIYL